MVSSSRTRSAETISIRSAIAPIAARTAGSTANPSWAANRAARIIRSGSSSKDCSGVTGVRSTPAARSASPPNGSTNVSDGQPHRHRVDREVAAREVALEGVAERDLRLAGRRVVHVRAVGGDLDDDVVRARRAPANRRAPIVPNSLPMSQCASPHAASSRGLVGRGRGREVQVRRRPPEERVPHRAADQRELVPGGREAAPSSSASGARVVSTAGARRRRAGRADGSGCRQARHSVPDSAAPLRAHGRPVQPRGSLQCRHVERSRPPGPGAPAARWAPAAHRTRPRRPRDAAAGGRGDLGRRARRRRRTARRRGDRAAQPRGPARVVPAQGSPRGRRDPRGGRGPRDRRGDRDPGAVLQRLGTIDYWFTGDDRRVHKVVHHFLLDAVGGELSVAGDPDGEAEDAAWVPVAELHSAVVPERAPARRRGPARPRRRGMSARSTLRRLASAALALGAGLSLASAAVRGTGGRCRRPPPRHHPRRPRSPRRSCGPATP